MTAVTPEFGRGDEENGEKSISELARNLKMSAITLKCLKVNLKSATLLVCHDILSWQDAKQLEHGKKLKLP